MTMKNARLALILPFAALAACETTTMDPAPTAPPRTPAATVAVGDAAAAAAAEARTGTVEGVTVVQAAAPASGRLGSTVASLGSATEGGMWLKTPLVKSSAKGRVVNPATGKSVNVNLIPLGGAASGGSQLSLPAMTALGIGLTDLPTVDVFAV